MLTIKALNIHMFRFYKHKELLFTTENGEITPMVLITGGNGKGKISIVDAIEWCLTGNVQHLNIPYAMRIKGDKLSSHCIGLLRNNDCKKQEETWVEIVFKEDEIETTIRRCTTSNEFGSENTSLFYIESGRTLGEDIAHQWLTERFYTGERPLEDFFYKYYICNLQKAEDFRCKGRSQMTEEFADFTHQHSEAKQVLMNLERLQIQLNTQIGELQKKKTDEQVIKSLEIEQQKLKENASIPEYIQRSIYREECLDVDKLSPEEQKEQLEKLISGGFYTVSERLKNLVSMQRKLTVKNEFEAHRSVIQQAIQKKLYDENTLYTINERYKKACEYLQTLTDKTLEQTGKFVSDLKCKEMTQEEWNVKWKECCVLRNIWFKTDCSLEDCKKGDELLTVFSRLVGVRTQIDNYRKEHKKCPLCGAEEPFVSEPAEKLVIEAENYVRAHDDKKLELARQVKEEKQIWTECQNHLLKDLEIALKSVIETLSDELASNKLIADSAKLFFTQIAELGMKPEQFAVTDALEAYDDMTKIDSSKISKLQESIRGLLNFLGYTNCDIVTTDPEMLNEQIKPLGDSSSQLFEFEEGNLRNKIISLRMRISNKHLADLTRDLDNKRKQNSILND